MGKTALWRQIEFELTTDITTGRFAPGQKLPTEAELSERFSVNRHTVRRAISAMVDQDLVTSLQGSGVYVRSRPTTLPIQHQGPLARLADCATPLQHRLEQLAHRPADSREATALNCAPADEVMVADSILVADGVPLCLCRDVVPAENMLTHRRQRITKAALLDRLHATWAMPLRLRNCRLSAKPATRVQARQLTIRPDSALLLSIEIHIDETSTPALFRQSWFPADRAALTLELDSCGRIGTTTPRAKPDRTPFEQTAVILHK